MAKSHLKYTRAKTVMVRGRLSADLPQGCWYMDLTFNHHGSSLFKVGETAAGELAWNDAHLYCHRYMDTWADVRSQWGARLDYVFKGLSSSHMIESQMLEKLWRLRMHSSVALRLFGCGIVTNPVSNILQRP